MTTALIIGTVDVSIASSLTRLVECVGAQSRVISPRDFVFREAHTGGMPTLLLGSVLDGLDEGVARAVLGAASSGPLLVHGLDDRKLVLEVLSETRGLRLEASPPARHQRYIFGEDAVLGPLAGLRLSEIDYRRLETLKPTSATRGLISTDGGLVFLEAATSGSPLYLSTVRCWPTGPPRLLRAAFTSSMFLDALPVLVFARRVLGGTAWRAPLCQANVIVDDPNLRFRRYGHLDFRQAATLAQERHFHLTVGFVPIDYRRTAPAIARLLQENPNSISLVFHGNDHLKREMGRNVAYSVADFSVRQALARMDHHRSLTGLRAARVMTLPHGVVNRVWVKALSSAGYAAAIARRSYSFAENPEEEGADALYEMRPAETSLLGFPIINRFRLEDPIEEVLFAAWLGKPIILYTHHHSFADWNTLVAKVEFVNRHAQPVWTDIETLVRHNYLLRQTSTIVEVATFSNDIEVTVPADCAKVILLRCGQDMAECGQTFDASNYTAQPLGSSPTEVSAALTLSERPDRLRVRFRTPVDDTPAPTGWHRTRHASRVRRVLTETRDRVYPAITAIRSF